MKKICYSLGLIVLFLVLSANACRESEDDDLNVRDGNLIGFWQFINSDGEVFSWRFRIGGEAVQTTPAITIEYYWTTQNDNVLNLEWTGNATTRRTSMKYRIEERNTLYFEVDGQWSAPYTRTAN